jgi:hypothetical protein
MGNTYETAEFNKKARMEKSGIRIGIATLPCKHRAKRKGARNPGRREREPKTCTMKSSRLCTEKKTESSVCQRVVVKELSEL